MDEHEDRIKRVTAFLELQLSQMCSYHNHKETMAHAAILIALALVGAVLATDQWPPEWIPAVRVPSRTLAVAGVTIVWLSIHVYMRWQLRNRRVAAIFVDCFIRLLRTWASNPPSEKDLKPYKESLPAISKIDQWIDLLIPWKWARLDTDEGIGGYPTAMITEYLKRDTNLSLAEYLVSYASITLWLVLLTRTWPWL